MPRKARLTAVSTMHIPFPEYPNVVSIIEGKAKGPRESDWHGHSWAEINVMLEGHGIWYTEDGPYEVGVGDGMLLMPQARHRAKWPAGVHFRTGSVGFLLGRESRSLFGFQDFDKGPGPPRAEVAAWLSDALSLKPYHRLTWKGFPEWWQRLYDEGEATGGPYRALRVESAILEALARFADPSFGKPEWEQPERRGIERALRLLSETISEGNVTVAVLARAAGMSRSKFNALFRRTLGMPPHTYATALRVWMAQSALAGSRTPAAEVAQRLGFASPQHFSRAFKTVTGLTPHQYRRRWAAGWVKEL